MSADLKTAATIHAELRERLKAEFGLEDGEDALVDTLDGISDFKELIAVAARQARYEHANVEALEKLIGDMQERKKRREAKRDRIRLAIGRAAIAAGEKYIDAPDNTISARPGTPKLIINEGKKPTKDSKFVIEKTVYVWDKEALKKAIESFDNYAMTIAHIEEEPEPTITIRSK